MEDKRRFDLKKFVYSLHYMHDCIDELENLLHTGLLHYDLVCDVTFAEKNLKSALESLYAVYCTLHTVIDIMYVVFPKDGDSDVQS